MTVRTRFAPSPTGFLHIGGVRTALFNWLLARHHGGLFLVRIDDTDAERHVEDAVKRILDGFRWIGIEWDEGPEVGGPHGPYFQSQRSESYRAALQRLIDSGHVYRDYSTEAERAADKAAAERQRRPYRFRRQTLSEQELARREDEGLPFALRFAVPSGRTLTVHDLIKGEVSFASDEIGDFVIVRPDGSPLYNFASVVDDIAMQITHVVRAEEHLSNTFPQLLVFEALGAPLPAFAHVPYVAEPGSKTKMSKRKTQEYESQGVLVYLHQYIERGYLPEALLNYLARLGWSFDGTQEIFTRAELIDKFTLERVNSSPASHDQDKLFWIQGEWMKALPLDQKVAGVLPYLQREGLVGEPETDADRAKIEAVILALGDRLKVFSDILKLGRFFFTTQHAGGGTSGPVSVNVSAVEIGMSPGAAAASTSVNVPAVGIGVSPGGAAAFVLDPDAVKKRLRKDGVPAMLAELDAVLAAVEPYDLATLEKAVHDYAERTGRKMGDVVNPLRVATTGQAVGPGLYDCLFILGRQTCRDRLAQTITMLEENAAKT